MAKCRIGKTGACQASFVQRKMRSISAVGQQYMDVTIVRSLNAV